jgi:hypothetical protein
MEWLEKLMGVATNLIPPIDGATDIHVRRWRLWVAGVTFVNAFGLTIHIALACGLIPFYPGFAQAGEVKTTQQAVDNLANELKAQRVGIIEASILDTRQKQCASQPEVRRLYTASLQKLLIEYRNITKSDYPVPGCEAF